MSYASNMENIKALENLFRTHYYCAYAGTAVVDASKARHAPREWLNLNSSRNTPLINIRFGGDTVTKLGVYPEYAYDQESKFLLKMLQELGVVEEHQTHERNKDYIAYIGIDISEKGLANKINQKAAELLPDEKVVRKINKLHEPFEVYAERSEGLVVKAEGVASNIRFRALRAIEDIKAASEFLTPAEGLDLMHEGAKIAEVDVAVRGSWEARTAKALASAQVRSS